MEEGQEFSEEKLAFGWVRGLVTDVTKRVTIQCDESTGGLGATLLQDGRPVASVSRYLTKSERKKNYVALELECLAIVFMCNREVHIYLWLKNSGRNRSQTIRDHCKKVSFVYSQLAAKNATPATETQFRNCVSSQWSTVDSRYVVTVTSKYATHWWSNNTRGVSNGTS